jgi:hypothetical protein
VVPRNSLVDVHSTRDQEPKLSKHDTLQASFAIASSPPPARLKYHEFVLCRHQPESLGTLKSSATIVPALALLYPPQAVTVHSLNIGARGSEFKTVAVHFTLPTAPSSPFPNHDAFTIPSKTKTCTKPSQRLTRSLTYFVQVACACSQYLISPAYHLSEPSSPGTAGIMDLSSRLCGLSAPLPPRSAHKVPKRLSKHAASARSRKRTAHLSRRIRRAMLRPRNMDTGKLSSISGANILHSDVSVALLSFARFILMRLSFQLYSSSFELASKPLKDDTSPAHAVLGPPSLKTHPLTCGNDLSLVHSPASSDEVVDFPPLTHRQLESGTTWSRLSSVAYDAIPSVLISPRPFTSLAMNSIHAKLLQTLPSIIAPLSPRFSSTGMASIRHSLIALLPMSTRHRFAELILLFVLLRSVRTHTFWHHILRRLYGRLPSHPLFRL